MKTICQSCGANIDEATRQYFWDRLPRADFDFDCPECNVTQEVEVIPVPTFKLFLKQRPTPRALDGACAHRELYPSGRCVYCLEVVEQVPPRQ